MDENETNEASGDDEDENHSSGSEWESVNSADEGDASDDYLAVDDDDDDARLEAARGALKLRPSPRTFMAFSSFSCKDSHSNKSWAQKIGGRRDSEASKEVSSPQPYLVESQFDGLLIFGGGESLKQDNHFRNCGDLWRLSPEVKPFLKKNIFFYEFSLVSLEC